MQLSRFSMYDDIFKSIGRPLGGRILGISGSEGIRHILDPAAELIEVQYPEVDMQQLPFLDSSFDGVLSDQVIEHVAEPWRAMKEAYRVLRPGGLGIHTTCFLNPIHPSPNDYYRFSPEGLVALCPPDAEVVRSASWGNRLALLLLLLRDGARRLEIPERSRFRRALATWNEQKYPIVTWLIVRRPREQPEVLQ